LAAFFQNHIGRPDFDVDSISLTRQDGLHIRFATVSVWQIIPVPSVGGVDLAQAYSQPSLGERHRIASCACVKDL